MYSTIRNICFGMGLLLLTSLLPTTATANEIPKNVVNAQTNQEVAIRWGVGFYSGYGPYFYAGRPSYYRHNYYSYPYRYRYYSYPYNYRYNYPGYYNYSRYPYYYNRYYYDWD